MKQAPDVADNMQDSIAKPASDRKFDPTTQHAGNGAGPSTASSDAMPTIANGKRKRSPAVSENGVKDRSRQTSGSFTHRFRIEKHLGYKEYVYKLRDGHEVRANDCIYLVCEPAGEPYYLGRIMEFTKLSSQSEGLDAVRINWFYRPRDIQRQNSDSRLVFATMHSDISPLSSVRAKCNVLHKSQIPDFEQYRKQKDCFYYDRLFDKFMRRQYEVIPSQSVRNVPDEVKEVLLKRWKFVIVEVNRSKELSMEHRSCRTCSGWCSSKDSVRCAICEADFHMQCVFPPLPRKPTRGFAWSCTPCSRAAAQKILDDHSVQLSEAVTNIPEQSSSEDDYIPNLSSADIRPEDIDVTKQLDRVNDHLPPAMSPENVAVSRPELWPFRYLGIHCNVNDAVDYDDRIYPRAASRIGQRHQAVVQDWPGRPVEYFDRVKRPIKRTAKAMKGKRTEERAAMDASPLAPHASTNDASVQEHIWPELQQDPTALSNNERPSWLQERPPNYIPRGEGTTSDCLWVPPLDISEEALTHYFESIEPVAQRLAVDWRSPNFLDLALQSLYQAGYDTVHAAEHVATITRSRLAEPSFSVEERARFEQSITLHGSELALVASDVGSKSVADCIRFYYLWKKTSRGARIWANSEARGAKSNVTNGNSSAQSTKHDLDQLGDSSDDSAYSTVKVAKLRKSFKCKFCGTDNSSRWHRAPGSPYKHPISALCQRCANLWRRYAVMWVSPEETYRKLHDSSYKGRKKKMEEELLQELPADGSRPDKLRDENADSIRTLKRPKKAEKVKSQQLGSPANVSSCAVCLQSGTSFCTCARCALCVHSGCYGITTQVDTYGEEWLCDTCSNDATPSHSMDYTCILCYTREPDKPAALKRTVDRNWVHVSCAVWNNDISFGDTSKMQPIQGISSIALDQWQTVCEICRNDRGACVPCFACDRQVHVECALRAKYKLGFDLRPVKSSQSRREGLSLVRIGSENGLMTAVISCPEHKLDGQKLHLANEMIDEVSETVISLYVKAYKSEASNTTRPAIMNESRRSTQMFNPGTVHVKDQVSKGTSGVQNESWPSDKSAVSRRCELCSVEYSPAFYSTHATSEQKPASEKRFCHRCHWQQVKAIHASSECK